eukprot:478064_1
MSLTKALSRQATLFSAVGAAALVSYRTYSKVSEQIRLEQQLKSIARNYLNKVQNSNVNDKKSLMEESRKQVHEFEQQGTAALNLVCSTFGFPPDNELGALVLEMLAEWNAWAYDHLLDHIEQIVNKQTYKVEILEIGPGAGDGIEKILNRFSDRVGKVHGFDVSNSSIELLSRKFAKKIKNNSVAIEYANIGDENDPVIKEKTKKKAVKCDIIFHINCFYFWDNVSVCGEKLGELLAHNGYLVGGFRWNYLGRTPENVFKNRKQSDYLDMLRDCDAFDMDTMKIYDEVGGDPNFQIIVIQKK